MENKDIVIIALIALIIYLYWQQIQQKNLPIQPNNQELSELKNQVQHYQTLYQKRVEADITGNQEKEIQSLTENLTSSQQQNNLYQQKIGDLENQVLDIAKQKIKGKKDAEKLLAQLEGVWEQEKKEHEENRKNLAKTIQQKERTIIELNNSYQKLEKTSANQVEQIEQLKRGLNLKTKELEKANKLVSIDKRWLAEKNEEYQEIRQKVLEIIDKPLVFFYGKSEVLEYLKGRPLLG